LELIPILPATQMGEIPEPGGSCSWKTYLDLPSMISTLFLRRLIAQLCTREKCSVRQVNMTISFAPVEAAVEGRLPRGRGIERLRDSADRMEPAVRGARTSIRNNRSHRPKVPNCKRKTRNTASTALGLRAQPRPPGTELLDVQTANSPRRDRTSLLNSSQERNFLLQRPGGETGSFA
jgi:hypothetical protein